MEINPVSEMQLKESGREEEKKEKTILHHISLQELLSEIDQIYDLSPLQRDGFLDCLCPIHKTSDFRTLTLHVKEQNFRCSFPQCKGFMGGTFIDLFAWTLDCTREEAMNYWIKKMQGIPVSLRAFALGLHKGSPANTSTIEMDKTAEPGIKEPSSLISREKFMEILELEIKRSQRYHCALSLVFLGIKGEDSNWNYPKNGSYWQENIAATLSKTLRPHDQISFYGFDRFILLLPEIDKQNASLVVERLRNVIIDQIQPELSVPSIEPVISFMIAGLNEKNEANMDAKSLLSESFEKFLEIPAIH